jgi:hypothetical protein
LDHLARAETQPFASIAERSSAEAARMTLPLEKTHRRRRVCQQPRDLLRADRRAPALIGRHEELAALQAWISEPARVGLRCITGNPGTGKSRLAIELCAWAETQGWIAGFAMPNMPGGKVTAPRRGKPLLVVIDDAGTTGACAVEAAALLLDRDKSKLRLLLLDRVVDTHSEWWRDLAAQCPEPQPDPTRLGGLRSVADRRALLGEAMAFAARIAGLPATAPATGAILDTGDPLHLLMAGLVAPHSGIARALAQPAAKLAGQLALEEILRLEHLAGPLHIDPHLLVHLVACVTLRGGCPLSQTAALIAGETHAMGLHLPAGADHAADVLADLLLSPDGTRLEAIVPDLLGQAFVTHSLERHPQETRAAIIARARV